LFKERKRRVEVMHENCKGSDCLYYPYAGQLRKAKCFFCKDGSNFRDINNLVKMIKKTKPAAKTKEGKRKVIKKIDKNFTERKRKIDYLLRDKETVSFLLMEIIKTLTEKINELVEDSNQKEEKINELTKKLDNRT
jgi:hypothetical protein